MEETLYKNNQQIILDADCKKKDVIVLLKGKGENSVQLNGKTILTETTGHHKIRFTKDHFCLLNDSTLLFYTLKGELVSKCDIGNDVFELFPYRQGVLCIYGDEGAFGEKLGKKRLNYATPLHKPVSLYDIAVQNNLLYDFLFARYKPYACIGWATAELFLLNEQLEKEKTIKLPFDPGYTIAFALTFEYGIFLEDKRMRFWDFEKSEQLYEYPWEYSYKTRAIFNRHEYLFLTVMDHELKVFKPILS